MSERELGVRREKSRQILLKSGAHYVIPSIRELPAVIKDINQRLEKGETPTSGLESAKPAAVANCKQAVRMR